MYPDIHKPKVARLFLNSNVTSLGWFPGGNLSSGGMAALLTAQSFGLATCLCLGNFFLEFLCSPNKSLDLFKVNFYFVPW